MELKTHIILGYCILLSPIVVPILVFWIYLIREILIESGDGDCWSDREEGK